MSRSTTIVTLVACLATIAGCATSPDTKPGRRADRAHLPTTPDTGSRIARAALDVLGTPYRFGGNDENGFDCSGLVQYAHAKVGISIPRTTARQLGAANRQPDRLQIGDVLFFRIKGHISHNGIYLGNGRFVHAPSKGKNVSIARTDSPYFRKRLAGIRRFH